MRGEPKRTQPEKQERAGRGVGAGEIKRSPPLRVADTSLTSNRVSRAQRATINSEPFAGAHPTLRTRSSIEQPTPRA